jgi:AcrR family transcriptional regulator
VPVSTATIYHYVTSKEELLVDIMRASQTVLLELGQRLVEDAERPEEQLAMLVGGLVAMHAVNPRNSALADIELRSLRPGTSQHAEIIGLRDAYEGLWRSVLVGGVEQGVFHCADTRVARLGLLTMCTRTHEWYRPDGPLSLEQVCFCFTDLALSALAARRRSRIQAKHVRQIDLSTIRRMPWEPAVGCDAQEVAERD